MSAKLDELTETSILGVFATHPKKIDFFLLHGVTGNHAVRMIFPHLSLEMQRRLLRVNLLGLLSDYVVERKPKINVDLINGTTLYYNLNVIYQYVFKPSLQG